MPTKNPKKPLLRRKGMQPDNTPAGAGGFVPNLLVDTAMTKAQVEASLNRAMIIGKKKPEPEVVEVKAPEPPQEDLQQPILITNVRGVSTRTQQRFANKLRAYQKSMTRFLVMEVVPYEAALINAKEDAEEVVRIITGAQVASLSLGKSTNYIEHIIPETKTLRWFATKMGLPKGDIESLMGLYFDSLQPKAQTPRKPQHNEEIQELIAALRQYSRHGKQSLGVGAGQPKRATRRSKRPEMEEGWEDA